MPKKGKGPSADDLLKADCKTWSVQFRDPPPKEKADARNARQALVKKDIETAKTEYYQSMAAPSKAVADWFFRSTDPATEAA